MTLIGRSIHITGDITSDEDLAIHGRVTGTITLRSSAVMVAPEAEVDADLRGGRVLVLGRVNGAIVASERIELGTTASVTGSLSANQVVLIEGAWFTGNIDMNQRTIAAKLATYRTTHGAAQAPTARQVPIRARRGAP
jgi:cytoskeletal protein CcmA (bactofilin family)